MSSLLSDPRSAQFAPAEVTVAAGLLVAASALLLERTLSSSSSGDYAISAPVAGDNAGPAIDALIHGHLASASAHQPVMGLTSIILRLPAVALATVLGAPQSRLYAVGALACLLPLLLLATWMTAQRPAATGQPLAGAVAAAILLAGPATWEAVNSGHAEEVLAGALATGAVLAAIGAAENWSWVLLGLAAGTKQWALIALPCVLIALPARRLAVCAKACALALALSAALPLADPGAFAQASSSVGGVHFTNPLSLWWPLGSRLAPVHDTTLVPSVHELPLGLTRATAGALAMAVVLCGLWMYGRHRRGRGIDALALLALVGLARAVTDPDPLQYYFLALLIPLAVWEAVRLGRLPVLTALACAWVAVLARASAHVSHGLLNGFSIAGALALGCYLTYRVFRVRGQQQALTLGFPAYGSIGEGI